MKNLSIGKKIAVVFGAILLAAAAITAIGLWQLNTVITSTRSMMAVPLAKERLVSDWYRVIYGGNRRTLAIAASSDSSLVKFFAEDQAQGVKEVGEVIDKVKPLLASPEEQQFVQQLLDIRTAYNGMRVQ